MAVKLTQPQQWVKERDQMQCPTTLRSNKRFLSMMRAISYVCLVVQEEILSCARNQSLFPQNKYILWLCGWKLKDYGSFSLLTY